VGITTVIVTTSDLKLHCSSADERSSVYGALPVNSVIDNSNCGNVSRELWQSTVESTNLHSGSN